MLQKKKIYFVDPDLHTDHPGSTEMEKPWKQFSKPWKIISRHKEAPVAPITTGGSAWTLVRDETHRALGTINPTTGKVRWSSLSRAPFGHDQVDKTVELEPYLESGIPQLDTPLARVLQRDAVEAFSVDENVRARGGDPNARSKFKHPRIGIRRNLRTNKLIVANIGNT